MPESHGRVIRGLVWLSIRLELDALLGIVKLIEPTLRDLNAQLQEEMKQLRWRHWSPQDRMRAVSLFSSSEGLKNQRQLVFRSIAVMMWAVVEDQLKQMIRWGNRLKPKTMNRIDFRRIRLYFEAVRQPLDALDGYPKVKQLNSVCNQIKHEGAVATKALASLGYASEAGHRIELAEEHLTEFADACRQFVRAAARVAPTEGQAETE